MKRKGDIVSYTADEIDAMIARGESKTDWAKVAAMTEEELEASIAADPDDTHEPIDWSKSFRGLPPGVPYIPRKQDVHIRLDSDLVGWFKSHGRGYQTRINAVLRAYVAAQKRAAE